MGLLNFLKLKPFWDYFIKLKKDSYSLFKFLKHTNLLKSDPSFIYIYFEAVYELETKYAKHDSVIKMYLSVSVREFFKDQYYRKKDFFVDAVMAELSSEEYDLIRTNMQTDLKDLYDVFSEKISSLRTPYEVRTEGLLNRISDDINSKIDLEDTIQTIAKLRAENKHSRVLEILLQLKIMNWAQISDRSKYHLQLEIGKTHEDLAHYKDASKCYISLTDYHFNTLEALSLAAYGYSLISEHNSAIEFAERALALSSKSKYAILAKLKVYSQPVSLDQLRNIVSEDLWFDEDIVFTGSLLLTKSGFPNDALEYISSINIDDVKNISLKFDLLSLKSELRITRIENRQRFYYKQYTHEEKNTIIDAEIDYAKAFDYYEQIGRGPEKIYMLTNIASLRRMVGDDVAAEKVLRRAILIKKDYSIYRMLLLLPHLTMDQLDDIILECESLELKDNHKIELAVSKYNSYHLKGQRDEGLNVLLKSEQFINSADEKLQYYPIIIDSLLDNQKYEDAQSYISSILDLFPDNPLGYYYQELLNTNLNKTDVRSTYLDIAKSKLTTESPGPYFDLIGELYITYGNIKAAIEVINLCPMSNIGLGKLTDKLLKLHAKNGSHAEGIRIAEKLLAENSNNSSLVVYLVDLYTQNGKLEKAKDIMKTYLDNEPGSDPIRLRLALTYHRLGAIGDSIAQIELIQSLESFPPLDQFNIGLILLSSNDRKEEGVSLLYKVRLEEYHNPEVHERFVQSITMNYRRPIHEVEPEVVNTDCYVELSSIGGNVLEYIITEKRLERNAVLPTEFPGNILIGLRIGDVADIGQDSYRVDKIWSKVTYAFRDSLRQIETRFSNDDLSLKVLKFKGDTDEEKLSGLFQIIKEVQAHTEKVEEIYERELLPFGTCCSLLKNNPISYWFDLRNKKIGIVSTLNNKDVIGKTFNEPRDCIFDITAILTSYYCENIDLYRRVLKQLFVSKSTVDLIRYEISEAELLVNKHGPLQEIEFTELNLLSIDKNNTIAWLYLLRSIFEYVNQNFKEIDSDPSNDYQKTVEFNRQFGISFYDSIRIAENRGLFFVSEDARFNLIAYSISGINCSSTSELLVSLLENSGIQLDEYYEEIAKLYHFNYMNLPINGQILAKLYEVSGFEMANPFLLGLNRTVKCEVEVKLVHLMYLQFFGTLLAKYSEAIVNRKLVQTLVKEVKRYSEDSFPHFISSFRQLLQRMTPQYPSRSVAVLKFLDESCQE